jgi:hypothetical protein
LNANLMTFADGTTFAGTGTMTMPGTTTVTAANVDLTLPTVLTSWLTGPGKVTVKAPFTWLRNSIGIATLEVAPGATFTIDTPDDHGLNNTVLRNHGTVQWSGGGRLLYQSGGNTVINEADGIWNIGAGSFQLFGGSGQVFTNLGLIQGAGAGTTTLTVSTLIAFTQGTTAAITIIY